MKVIKNINNNVSLCLDSKGKEVVVFGKGIGFIKPPLKVELDKVERTFYNLDETYIKMMNDLSDEAIKIADQVVNYANLKIDCELNSNLVFTLADHLDFAIKRYRQNIQVSLPIATDIEHLFEQEMEIGRYALQLIQQEIQITLPKEEAACIALNILNSEVNHSNKRSQEDEKIILHISKMIEKCFAIQLDKNSFNYSRFVSHMVYLLKRGQQKKTIKSENRQLYSTLALTYPKTFECAERIKAYLCENRNWLLSDEECLYLMLHINRLCSREDCYQ